MFLKVVWIFIMIYLFKFWNVQHSIALTGGVNLGKQGLNMKGTKVSSNNLFYSEHQTIYTWGVRNVTWVKLTITRTSQIRPKKNFHRLIWIATAEVILLLSAIPRGAWKNILRKILYLKEIQISRPVFLECSHKTPEFSHYSITGLCSNSSVLSRIPFILCKGSLSHSSNPLASACSSVSFTLSDTSNKQFHVLFMFWW